MLLRRRLFFYVKLSRINTSSVWLLRNNSLSLYCVLPFPSYLSYPGGDGTFGLCVRGVGTFGPEGSRKPGLLSLELSDPCYTTVTVLPV